MSAEAQFETTAPNRKAKVFAFPVRASGRKIDMKKVAASVARTVVPPMLVVLLMLLIWQVACSTPGASLPPPSVVWEQAGELIWNPLFDYGNGDIGLAWRVLASLQRVAVGFGIAAVVGVLVGAFIGQSVWAMRGLDPIFQILRTVPPLAWLPLSLAAFRDSHPSAIFVIFITSVWPVIINTAVGVRNIPNDYRNVAAILRLNPVEFFFKIMVPAAAPYIPHHFASLEQKK